MSIRCSLVQPLPKGATNTHLCIMSVVQWPSALGPGTNAALPARHPLTSGARPCREGEARGAGWSGSSCARHCSTISALSMHHASMSSMQLTQHAPVTPPRPCGAASPRWCCPARRPPSCPARCRSRPAARRARRAVGAKGKECMCVWRWGFGNISAAQMRLPPPPPLAADVELSRRGGCGWLQWICHCKDVTAS